MVQIWVVNLLTLLSAIFLAFWIYIDPRPETERFNSYLRPKTVLISVFIFAFFLMNYLSGLFFPLPASELDSVFWVLGVVVFFAGAGLSIWAKITMGKVWGMPGEHNKHRQNKLITTGPFHYTRNPIYLGQVLLLMGYGLALQSYFIFLVLIPVFYYFVSIEKEEKILEDIFKHEYLEYKKKVPRFF